MKKLICVAMALCLLTSIFCGCGKADISSYSDSQILVTGLLEEDFYVTPAELAELECVNTTTTGNTAKAGTVQAYGPTLETFLAHYGKELSEFRSVRFCASDDYDVTIGRVSWNKFDVILSIANGSKPLDEWQQPLRIVIPGGDSGNWVRLVTEIHFEYAGA